MTKKIPLPPMLAPWLIVIAAIAIAALLSSCAYTGPPEPRSMVEPQPPVTEKKPAPESMKAPPPSRLYEWYGGDGYVSRIEVSINEQKARFYSGDKEVGWTTVASGVHRYPTPTGSFAVLEKVRNKRSNLYGRIYDKNGRLVKRNAKMGVDPIPKGGRFRGASMPYFLRLTNDGIGMHAGPIPRPGNRASHGCIRMPKRFALILYHLVDVGTPVVVEGNGPTYTKYLARQGRSAPKAAATAVVRADPTPASEAAPATGTPDVFAAGTETESVTASDGTPPVLQPTGIARPVPVTTTLVKESQSTTGVSDNSQEPEAIQPVNPTTGVASPIAETSVPLLSTPLDAAAPTDAAVPSAGASGMGAEPAASPSDSVPPPVPGGAPSPEPAATGSPGSVSSMR
jgi:lipoprotein-anchoring transpeptidase ErfK/SrfK